MITTTRIVLSVCILAAVAPGQQLRRGILDAEAVVVARPVGVLSLGEKRLLHRFEVVETLTGDLTGRFSII